MFITLCPTEGQCPADKIARFYPDEATCESFAKQINDGHTRDMAVCVEEPEFVIYPKGG